MTVAAGEEWDDRRRPGGRARLGRHRGAVGHPGCGGRDADPERRRLRPGRRADDRVGPGLGPQAARRPHLRQRRLRVRLPALPLQGRPRAARRARRDLPVHPGRPRRARRLRRAGPHPRRRRSASGRRWPTYARRCWGCAAARAWSSTPTTTTPGAPGRSSPTRSSTRRPSPTAPRPGPRTAASRSSAAWLIEHAGFGKGYGAELTDGRASLSTKHTLALTNRGGAIGRGPARRGARGPRRRRAGARHPAGQRAGAGRLRALTRLRRRPRRSPRTATPNDEDAPARAGRSR